MARYSDDIVPEMTANNAPVPYVASAISEYSADYAAWKAFDNNFASTCWYATDAGVNKWLKIYINSSAKVAKYTVTSGDLLTHSPKSWTLQGSNDDNSWDTIDTVVDYIFGGTFEKAEFTCDTITTSYKYFKIDVSKNQNNDIANCRIGEIELITKIEAVNLGIGNPYIF